MRGWMRNYRRIDRLALRFMFYALSLNCIMELGISSFAELTPDPITGKTISGHQRMKDLMEEIELADQIGRDVFALGEHHRPDFIVSSPAVVLGAAAVKTNHIKLSSAVTVLSSDDPVKVFQDFAMVDLLSGGCRPGSAPVGRSFPRICLGGFPAGRGRIFPILCLRHV